MTETGSMNRKNKKERLRRMMIRMDTDKIPPSRNSKNEKVAWKNHKRRRTVIVVLLALVGITLFFWFYYQQNYAFTNFKTVWSKDINEGSLVGYESFGSNVLRVTKDGATYMDNNGKNIWTESYEMKNPVAYVNDDYAVIANIQGNSIYICNTDGVQGRATTTDPISKVTISRTGIVAAVLEESNSSNIMFFDKDGTILDVSVRSNIAGNGYPLDISLSGDGTQLMVSYVFIQNSYLKNRVVFYDFSEIGKSKSNRLVGGFDEEFQDALVGSVQFLGKPYSCALSTRKLIFFSCENLMSPIPIVQVPIEEEIQSVFYSDDYVGIVVKNNSEKSLNRMEIYKKNGELIMKKEFTYDYTGVDIDGNLIILNNEDSCMVYNMHGVLKFCASFDFTISKIRRDSFPNTLVVTGPQMMKKIRLY